MSHITTCPHCSSQLSVSEQITEKTLICPHCLADVDNPQPGLQVRAANINTDVKRDVRMGNIVLAVFIGFCVLGIALVILGESGSLAGFSCTAFVWLFCIAIIFGLIRMRDSGVRITFAQKMLGCAVLAVGTIVAIYIFIVLCCWNYQVVSH